MKNSLKGFYSTWTFKPSAQLILKYSAIINIFLLISSLALGAPKETLKKPGKDQQVNFDESAVNGTVRRPDGFLLNKGTDPTLSPLFNAKKNIEERIQKSNFILK